MLTLHAIAPKLLGDKTPIGWTITVSYFIVTALCYAAYRSESRYQALNRDPLRVRFWFWLTAIMAFLGFNKQLDLQRAFTKLLRVTAIHLHVWSHRRPFQMAFILAMALVGLVVMGVLAKKLKGLGQWHKLALVGMGLLGIFVVTRAASFHYVDIALGMKFHNVYVNTVLELGGIIWIGIAAVGCRLEQRRHPALPTP